MDKKEDIFIVIQMKPKLDIIGCVKDKSLFNNKENYEYKFLKMPFYLKETKKEETFFDKIRNFDFFQL